MNVNRSETVLLLNAQISVILLKLLSSPKNYHKTRVTVNTTKWCSGMVKENVIIVGGQDLSDPCENERVDAFIGLNI